MKSALILVDIQKDFVPGGSLAVPEGNEIIPIVQKLLGLTFDEVVATKDWHPRNHCSFAPTHKREVGEVIDMEGIPQILWPVHCVQESSGADFVEGWDTSKISKEIHKGVDPLVDSYSTFFDNARRRSTGLEDYLKSKGIERVFLAGLATDYCVKYSVMDALDLGFDTFVIADACKGINLREGDIDHALNLVEKLGAHLCYSADIPGLLAPRQ
ncbi:MAG: bifunctional nicotinamidase/pyrazinamidase [Chlamydiales bacterium]|nr:bifunctional nicotinamidase/pyrazinamidase [Chlamydiales bacterium]